MPGSFTYTPSTGWLQVTAGTSGSPADFASLLAADRAGTGTTLLSAWAPISNTKALTYQIRPVELLSLLISFVVASKTSETDYIFITGTDRLGGATTESINVSSGNGTYVTTTYFKTITNIDCSDSATGGGTVWSDGTVAVTQPIWGVVWDKGNGVYKLDAKMYIGDGSTSTYFADIKKTIIIDQSAITGSYQVMFYVYANATIRFGELINAAEYTSRYGCVFVIDVPSYLEWFLCRSYSASGYSYIYSCSILNVGGNSLYPTYGSNGYIWNTQIIGTAYHYAVSMYNIYQSGPGARFLQSGPTPCDKITLNAINYMGMISGTTVIAVYNIIARDNTYAFEIYNATSAKVYMINCYPDAWGINHTGASKLGQGFRQYTFNLNVADNTGANIAGAVVNLYDTSGSPVWTENSLVTDANGNLPTFSGIGNHASAALNNAVTHTKYYYSGSALEETYNTFTLTVTKSGYQDYRDVITIDRKMDLEIALLAASRKASPTQMGLVAIGSKQGIV